MSAPARSHRRSAGLAAGACAYIRKPFNALELGDRIREICGATA
jgi:DNA-binding response OmpR family regulator